MCKLLALLFSGIFIATSLVALSSTPASAAVTLTTCTDLSSKVSNALKATQKSCKPLLAPAVWHLQQSDSPAHSGAGFATIRICSSQNSVFTYQYIKKSCPKYQVTTDYWRAVTELSIPLITSSSAIGYDGAAFALSAAIQTTDAPIAYYLITNIKTGQIDRVIPSNSGGLSLSNLSPLTSYTFTIAAVSVDGTSTSSSITPVITTGAVPVAEPSPAVTSAPALAAPAFTLTSIAETKTVNTAATGFTISSTGGAIASFGISAIPAGMSFSTSTGALSGTPTSVVGGTAYIVTATNASGSATRTFTLTVIAAGVYTVGQRGSGGGIVFYVSATNFTSTGSTCNTACKYLEVAPAGWNNGAVVESDHDLLWSSNTSTLTGQDLTTAIVESGFVGEKFNWKIGQGFYNTSVMKVADATSGAQAAVRAYAGTSIAGQWFIPSMNELNELCKYAWGQTTGVLTVACTVGGTLKSGIDNDLGGFVSDFYFSSSESSDQNAWGQYFNIGINQGRQDFAFKSPGAVRPVRAF